MIFIPKFGINGGALTTAISYFFLFFGTVIVYAGLSGNKIRDIVFLKKEDINLYKNIVSLVKNKKV
jgi:Na+-driven multidrug efflux pump